MGDYLLSRPMGYDEQSEKQAGLINIRHKTVKYSIQYYSMFHLQLHHFLVPFPIQRQDLLSSNLQNRYNNIVSSDIADITFIPVII